MRFLLLALTLLLPAAAHAQLSGTYTIGGSSPDYATIEAAVNDLDDFGLSGDVTLLLRPGTYTEQINPGALGSSATQRVTFEPENLTSRAVIQFDATASNNYLWRINNTEYLSFIGLDFVERARTPRTRPRRRYRDVHRHRGRHGPRRGCESMERDRCDIDGRLDAGRHTAQSEAAGPASGVYLVRMVTNGFAQVQRVTLAH